jgi:hypothetical protein
MTDVVSVEQVYNENKQRSELEQLNLLVKDSDKTEQKERNIARTMVLLRISAILVLIIVVRTSSSSNSQVRAGSPVCLYSRSTQVYLRQHHDGLPGKTE